MRVALISYHFGEYCVRLAASLARSAEVMLLLPEKEMEAHSHLDRPGLHLRPFRAPRLRQPVRQARTAKSICREVRDFRPDVVHLQQGQLWFNFALGFLPRCGFVLTVHDVRVHPGDKPSKMTPQWILDIGVRRADHIIVHAQQIKSLVLAEYRLPETCVHVIPHVQLGENKHAPNKRHPGPPTVLFFGRIWPYKGLEYLIRAEPFITAAVPDAKIVIAGQGESLDRYRKMMVHPDRFVIHNEYIPDQQRAALFEQASVVALPYIEASQSGVVPLAYTHCKPVVATRVGGLPEIVEHGSTGFCIPPRDEHALAEAIIAILKDKHVAETFGANGHAKITTECSPDRVAAQTLQVYRLLTGESSTIRRPACGALGATTYQPTPE